MRFAELLAIVASLLFGSVRAGDRSGGPNLRPALKWHDDPQNEIALP